MKNINYFQELSFHKFNTPEYVTIMDRFISQTIALGAEKLHYEEADVDRLRQLHTQLQNNVARTTACPETIKLQALDVERSTLGQYIITSVRNSLSLPLAEKAAAATALYTVLKPYVGFYNQPAPQKTATIEGMLIDLNQESMQTYITALGLGNYIETLTLKNAQYKVILEQRTQARTANKAVDSATLRQEMDSLYKYITTVAFAHNVLTPSDEIDAYILTINAILSEANASYNQRTAKTEKNENPDSPENSDNADNTENQESPTTPDSTDSSIEQ